MLAPERGQFYAFLIVITKHIELFDVSGELKSISPSPLTSGSRGSKKRRRRNGGRKRRYENGSRSCGKKRRGRTSRK